MLKRFAIVLLLSASCFAAIGSIQGGAFQDVSGNPLNGGTLTLTLSGPAQIIGTGQALPGITYTITLNSSGSVPNPTPLWQNDQLSPSGTYYIATLYSASGALVRGPENWSITGASPVNLASIVAATPTLSFTPTYVFPGVFTNTQPNFGVYSQQGALSFAGTGLPNETDAFTGVTGMPVGATVHQSNGGSFTCYSSAVSSPLGAAENCVGVFGVGAALVNNSASWGANFGSSAATGTSGTLVIGVETDLGLVAGSAPNRFQGHLITGAALAGTMPAGPVMGTIPGGSTSVAMGYGDSFPSSSTTQFPVMYYSSRGGAAIGLQLDANCYTGACNSQSIQLGANNGTTAMTSTLQTNQNGELFASSSATGVGMAPPSSTNANLSSSATNGTLLFCTDCTNTADDSHTAGAACAGSGHGALAVRQNGAWRCY